MSIGENLTEARHRAGLTVAQVSQQTRIREVIIQGIEQDDYSACGGDFYTRGHIRAVARAVGADPGPLIQEYDAAHGERDELGSTGEIPAIHDPHGGAGTSHRGPDADYSQPSTSYSGTHSRPGTSHGEADTEYSGVNVLHDGPATRHGAADAGYGAADTRYDESNAGYGVTDTRHGETGAGYGAAGIRYNGPDIGHDETNARYGGTGTNYNPPDSRYEGPDTWYGGSDAGYIEYSETDTDDGGSDDGYSEPGDRYSSTGDRHSGTTDRYSSTGDGYTGTSDQYGGTADRYSGAGGGYGRSGEVPAAEDARGGLDAILGGFDAGHDEPATDGYTRSHDRYSRPSGGYGRSGGIPPAEGARGGLDAILGGFDAGHDEPAGFTEPGPVPVARPVLADRSRRPNRAVIVAIAVLVVLAVVLYLLLSGGSGSPRPGAAGKSAHPQTGHSKAHPSPTVSATTSAPPVSPQPQVLRPVSAAAFGPTGTGQGDNPSQASLAIDQSSATAWETDWYNSSQFGNLQTGTGLLLDMGRTVTITSAEINVGSIPGGALQLRAGSSPVLADLPPAATASSAAGDVKLALTTPVHARYVLVWFTKLPPDAAGTYQAQIYNIVLRGTG